MVTRNQIYIGSVEDPDYYFENDQIMSINGEFEVAIAGKELSIDTLTIKVIYDVEYPKIYKPTNSDGIRSDDEYILRGKSNNDIRELPYATPVWYYNKGKLIAQFYIKNVERVAKKQYVLNCISCVGLLDKMKHYGGYYNGLAFKHVLKDILLPSQSIYRLPFPYQEVEYLESNGVQYIDTGFKANSGMRIETEIETPGNSSMMMIFGESNSSGQDSYAIGIQSNSNSVNYYFGDMSQSVVSGDPEIEFNTRTKIIFNLVYNEPLTIPGYSIDDSVYPISPTYSFTTSTNNLYLFGLNSNGAFNAGFKGKITTVAVYNADDELIHFYVPCYLKSDNTAGMYDTIDGVFKTNSGSGTFSVGPEKGIGGVGQVMDYDLEENLGEQLVYGWLPYGTKRENLYSLLFAYNAVLMKNDQGKPYFVRLFTSTASSIIDDRIYIDGSIDYGSPASRIEVTEHAFAYSSTVDEEQLFDNTNDGTVAEHQIVFFNGEPIKPESLRTSSNDLVIEYSNVNCACVSGNGILYGKPYIHTQRTLYKDNPAPVEENIITVSGSTLINVFNSNYILDRTYNYYALGRIVNNAIVVDGERCGRKYRFKDPFGDMREGYLEKMSMNASGLIKSNCDFIFGFNPVNSGGIYSNSVILTGSGDWTVPAEAIQRGSFLAILIGGGNGGYAGQAGGNGSANNRDDENAYYNQTIRDHNSGGEGGSGGSGGSGGKVRTVTVTGFGSTIHYSCGKGGKGQDPLFDLEAYSAEPFRNDTKYEIGDIVLFGDDIYICRYNDTPIGSFIRAHWKKFIVERPDNSTETYYDVYQAPNTPVKYDPTKSYAVGDYCIKASTFFKCKYAIPSGESWNPNHWREINYLSPKNGGDTSFGNYTTAVGGAVQPNGVLLYTTGDILAIRGENGVDGGAGGDWSVEGGYATYGQPVSYKGINYTGGRKGAHSYITYANFDGGRGSGAVVGRNGVNGDTAEATLVEEYEDEYQHYVEMTLDHLGFGADAPIPIPADAPTKYGCGGNGGHGGGGGGADGDGAVGDPGESYLWESSVRDTDHGGFGSRGSAGSDGADGCVIIYY